MGNEANCVARFGKQKARGKAQLETSELNFRSEDGAMRMKFTFADIKSAAAADGQLRVEVPEGTAIFELGANAAKWCEKILHPKTRLEKLGIKPNAAVSLVGNFAADFLSQVPKLAKSLKGAAALWIVYPKGQTQITENDVLAAGRKSGLKDVKVVGFSPTHTALKFVIPVESR